eukprot:10449865-Ditylum_brightwellii.AAC.1
MTLEHYINNVNSVIKSVQKTNKTDKEGKWLLVCTKADTLRGIRCVDFVLPTIFEEHITEVQKMIGYDCPRRHHNSGNKTTGLYAAKLKNNTNPTRLTSRQHTANNLTSRPSNGQTNVL